jgi:hypothetical protein
LKNKNDDECFCEECGHKKASECIDSLCKCCVEADKIRLSHPTFSPEVGLSEEEKTRRESDAEEEEYAQQKSSAIGDDSLYSLP